MSLRCNHYVTRSQVRRFLSDRMTCDTDTLLRHFVKRITPDEPSGTERRVKMVLNAMIRANEVQFDPCRSRLTFIANK